MKTLEDEARALNRAEKWKLYVWFWDKSVLLFILGYWLKTGWALPHGNEEAFQMTVVYLLFRAGRKNE